MEHYNGVARTLNKRPDCYGPLFAVDERHNDILWELWIVGFEKAVKLRPAAWQRLLTADTETARAISGLLTLADVDPRDARFAGSSGNSLRSAALTSRPAGNAFRPWYLRPGYKAHGFFLRYSPMILISTRLRRPPSNSP
jgi:hypothetical protein